MQSPLSENISTVNISLCMIVKDEEEVLAQCLESVKNLVNEIIIVDTGSSDRTKEIASKYTEKIFDFIWIDDFAAARNFAFSKAAMDYILWLDADDVLLAQDQDKFQTLKNNLKQDYDYVSMVYNTSFDEYGNITHSFRRNRLVKRNRNFKWHGAVHEYLEVYGNRFTSDIAVTHRRGDKKKSRPLSRNLAIYENLIKKGEYFSPRDLYYYANELKDNGRSEEALVYYRKFLATKRGWIEDVISACNYMADCYAQLGDEEKEIKALLNSLKYDKPKAGTCCRLGTYFLQKNNYHTAVVWYTLALNLNQNDSEGFTNPAYSTWYPHLQLCVCYWKLSELEKSQRHNEQAAKYYPEHPSILFNRKFFDDYFKDAQNNSNKNL